MNGELTKKTENLIEAGILPIKGLVAFPGLIVPLMVREMHLTELIKDVLANKTELSLFTVKEENEENEGNESESEIDVLEKTITLSSVYNVGVLAKIIRFSRLPDGSMRLLAQGVERVRIVEQTESEVYLKAKMEILKDIVDNSPEERVLMQSVIDQFSKVAALAPYIRDDATIIAASINEPGKLADMITVNLNISTADKQRLLEELNVKERLKIVLRLLSQELAILELTKEIKEKATSELGKAQRDYILREQLRIIQEELGEKDEKTREIEEFERKIKEANLPKEAYESAMRELDRLRIMNPATAEYIVSRTYLDWIVNLPWNISTEDNLDLDYVKRVLDEDHYNLENVKERVIEFLAIRKIKQDAKGSILCFVGPPGVGKTSVGMSIARALGRKFYRISLGGMRDEAEIRGHRRTYVGALPGRIIQGIRKAGSNNPVFMLDEVDKIGQDFRGDPAAALLEVLDPEQNFSFYDNYLEVPFDLSKVMFIATANYLDPVPKVLLDRMEVIHLPGYTEFEKIYIAKRHLIPKELDKHGLSKDQLSIPNCVIRKIVREYAQEAGVRNLDRAIQAICRKTAKAIAMGEKGKIRVTKANLKKFLGSPQYIETKLLKEPIPGVAVGLAWTPVGGEVLYIETTKMKGGKNLILTGHLGDVMKESAQTALSYLRSNAELFGINDDICSYEIHVHVPAGAIPKDGPSAGITIATALASLLLNKPMKKYLAMTGEITLRGDIMPVGGLKEKSLAAHRIGIKEIIIPEANKKDLDDIPKEILRDIKFIPLARVEQAIKYALEL